MTAVAVRCSAWLGVADFRDRQPNKKKPMANSSSSSGGIGFSGLLTIVFITLKLCGVINWPWLWVLSPIWIGVGIALVVLAIVGIVYWRTHK